MMLKHGTNPGTAHYISTGFFSGLIHFTSYILNLSICVTQRRQLIDDTLQRNPAHAIFIDVSAVKCLSTIQSGFKSKE